MKTIAIIPARGGSKGIPRKNLTPVCGMPLIAWSVIQAIEASSIDTVYVSSDDDEILRVAESFGAQPIKRPFDISGDTATSESAWIHAINTIEESGELLNLIVGMQATSPIRESRDIDCAVAEYHNKGYDSLMSANEIEDFHIWKISEQDQAESVNYDYKNRKRRQDMQPKYLENGSFYIFKPQLIKKFNNRLSGHIGLYVMEKYKMFQIDELTDIPFCEGVMKQYNIHRR